MLGRDVPFQPPATMLTIPGRLRHRAEKTPGATARWSLDRQGRWRPSTWQDYTAHAAAWAQGLRSMGVAEGAHVGLMAASSAAWDDCSMGVLAARGVVVGIDVYATAEQIVALGAISRLDVLVVDTVEQLARFGEARPALCVVLHPAGAELPAGCRSQADVLTMGRQRGLTGWDQARPDDVALVVFTSGTTGAAKAIAYRHAQVSEAVDAILEAFQDIREGSRLACWLPLSNLFQRIINLCAIDRAAQTFYVQDPRSIMLHLPFIQPAVFIGVPRFIEKFHLGVQAQLQSGPAWRQMLAHWACRVGHQHGARVASGKAPGWPLCMQHWLADWLVLQRVRAALGGRLRYLISGSAPMPPALLASMQALGLPVLEAYGLSECIVPIALNRADAHRPGTVGRPLRSIEVRVAADGELLVRSAGVFGGYLGDLASSPVVDADGWLATGDLADIDSDGFVRLVGRKSEVFKLSTGRRIAPAQIEALLAGVPGVEHLAVFGSGRRAPVVVASVATAASTAKVAGALRQQVVKALAGLPVYQRPVGAVLTHHPFASTSGELTGNLKLRRTQIALRYASALDALDAALGTPGPAVAMVNSAAPDESVELVRF